VYEWGRESKTRAAAWYMVAKVQHHIPLRVFAFTIRSPSE
jgi:hypothetical protein